MNEWANQYRRIFFDSLSDVRWRNVAIYASAASVALAIALFTWHKSLFQLQVPLNLMGDTVSSHYIMKTVVDHGWYLVNPDMAAPFTATMYDYPIPEPTSLSFIWLLGQLSTNPFVVFNLFYFAGFVSVAWAACWAFVRCGIARPLALAAAIAYAILPYHFLRLPHVFLASYFAVPIFCCYALRLAQGGDQALITPARLSWGTLILLAIAAGGGVYYAFFGCIFVAAGAIYAALRRADTATLRIGAAYVGVIVAVIVLSLLPNFVYHLVHGGNPLVANRNPAGAEIYGLRITQMLLPTVGHRIPGARKLIDSYNQNAPLVNENSTAALGIMGSIGFLIALAVFLFGVRRKFPVLSATGALITTGVLYATMGGFGALAAFFLIPDIRGLNRISVFIAFFGLFALLFVISKVPRRRYGHLITGIAAVAVVIVGCADQIPTHLMPSRHEARKKIAAYKEQQRAFDNLQFAMPSGTAVYELPYVFFPESPDREGSYTLFVPYLYTHGFRWSFGSMHGRLPDLWNERVSHLTGHAFASALAGSGFGAVYVDGMGYKDNGVAIDREMAALFGAPIWRFGNKTVYRIPTQTDAKPYTIAVYGQGWYGLEGAGNGASRTTWEWSRGNATLEIANPGKVPVSVSLRFTLDSVTSRNVSVRYDDHILDTYNLRSGHDASVTLNVIAKPGGSQIRLVTDAPGKLPGNGDPRKLAFRLNNLVTKTEQSNSE